MVQNLYPLFERNRILKKEMLWSLRDYSFSQIQLEYQRYSDGIIGGCDLEVRENEIIVKKGIVKHDGFIYLLTGETAVPYTPTEVTAALKLRLWVDRNSADYISYQAEFVLNDGLERNDDEIELCRFKLKAGSRLRKEYTDFYDIQTEFDTVNLVNATWAGIDRNTLSPVITDYFSRRLIQGQTKEPQDLAFAYLCLNQTKAVSREVIESYIGTRMGRGKAELSDNEELFSCMERILRDVYGQRDDRADMDIRRRRQIIVD